MCGPSGHVTYGDCGKVLCYGPTQGKSDLCKVPAFSLLSLGCGELVCSVRKAT